MKKNNAHITSESGFTLIEMVLVLIILGLVITPIFALLATEQTKRKTVEEGNREKTALVSLSIFLKKNGRYPCPANPSLTPDDNNFGQEFKSGVNCSNTTLSSDGKAYIGALPTSALNLPNRYAANLKNAKYIYGVTKELTSAATFTSGGGNIRVVNDKNGSFLPDPVHFILVNTGSDLKGVSALNGTVISVNCAGNGLDVENCDNDSIFREAPISLATNSQFNDDTIYFSLASEDSTFWILSPENSTASGLNITNRNMGNIGIGENNPTEKLHVKGGVLVQDGADGNVGKIEAENQIRAKSFYYK